jgi:hypothetical protein
MMNKNLYSLLNKTVQEWFALALKKTVIGEEEKEILNTFYNKVKSTITEAYGFAEDEADFETYRWILQNTDKPPADFMAIFDCIPEKAKKKILKHMGYKNEKTFRKSFTKNMNAYDNAYVRREKKGR